MREDRSAGDAEPERETEPQKFQIDGEALWFQKFVKIEAVPGAVDIIVDYEQMMR